MNVKKVSEKGNQLSLLVSNSSPQFLNAVRRTVMNAVPTLAIEDISIYRNDSVLFDEFVASRLGSLPLKAGKMKKKDKLRLVLHEKGPKTVLSGAIEAKNPGIEVVNKETPIVKLKEGQELKLEMEAVMDTGKENVKWQPAIISFNELPEIKNNVKKPKNGQKIVESCPKKVLELKAGKVVLKDPYKCTLCGYCEDLGEGQVELGFNKGSFVLNIESFGQMENREILKKAAKVLEEKASEFKSLVSKKLKK